MFSTNNRNVIILLTSSQFPTRARTRKLKKSPQLDIQSKTESRSKEQRMFQPGEWWPLFVLPVKPLPTSSHYLISSLCISLRLSLFDSIFLSLSTTSSLPSHWGALVQTLHCMAQKTSHTIHTHRHVRCLATVLCIISFLAYVTELSLS